MAIRGIRWSRPTAIAAALALAGVSEAQSPSPDVVAVVAEHRDGDHAAMERELTALAAAGDASAAELLGELLARPGRPGGADAERACTLFEQASATRVDSLHNLATCFFSGDGRATDHRRARALYAQAVERDSTQSLCALGNMLTGGLGGPRDVEKGLALCERGAAAGDADAQADYGIYFLAGQHVPKDTVEARKWLSLAAAQDHANAAFLLGQIYWNGDGVPKDNGEAARLWKIAYDGGRADAAMLIARESFVRMMADASSPRDVDPALLRQTLSWFELAAASDPGARKREETARMAATLNQLRAATE